MTATRVEAERTLLAGPVVIDASVAVEYLVAISLTAQAEALFRSVVDQDVELWAPDLLYPESVSALRRLLRLRAIGPQAAETAVGRLSRLPLTSTGTGSLMMRAWELRQAVTPYDACYVALAEALRVPFVTADRKLIRALSNREIRAVYLGDLS
ncbi:MAG TPA: type II toxin-antitoxin system VapC family toxin [Methylomirabilota bacterium]|nr:type II toxin-antitoxin system VapC family toxin [Methylomirabilota bacterium]